MVTVYSCTKDGNQWIFKKVYSMLDKGLFIEKMNNMIKDYGNLIIDLNNPNDLSYNIYSTTRIDWDNKSDSFLSK